MPLPTLRQVQEAGGITKWYSGAIWSHCTDSYRPIGGDWGSGSGPPGAPAGGVAPVGALGVAALPMTGSSRSGQGVRRCWLVAAEAEATPALGRMGPAGGAGATTETGSVLNARVR